MYKRLSLLVILVTLSLTGFFVYRVLQTKFDYNFEKFFPKNDPDTDFFLEHRKKFGSDNDFVLVGLVNRDGVFKKDFLEKVDRLTDSLEKLDNVISVLSPTTINEILRDPLIGTFNEVPYLRYQEEDLYLIDSIRIYHTPELVGSLFAKNGQAVSIMISHKEFMGDDDCKKISADVKNIAASYGFDEYHIAGRCIGQAYYTGLMQKELMFFLLLSFIFIIIVLVLIYRNFWGVVIPLLLVGINVIWTLGFMEVTGKDLDMLGNAIPTIIVVVGLSIAVHVMTKYYDYLVHGYQKLDGLRKTITQVGMPTIFTTVTTIVGFGSLKTVGVVPIEDFGVYTAAGVAISFILSYTFLPAMLLITPIPKHLPPAKERWSWKGFLQKFFTRLFKGKWVILIASGVLGAISIWGTLKVRENTKLLEDLGKKSQLSKDFQFFGKEFQGTRPFEMAIWVKDTSKTILDRDVLLEMEKMETYLRNEYGLSFIMSPVAIVKNAYKSSNNGDTAYYKIPESEARLQSITGELRAARNVEFVKSVFAPDFKTARIRSIMGDIGSNSAYKKNLAFYQFMGQQVNTSLFDYKLTGTAELSDKNNRNLAVNIFQGLLVSFVLITIIIAILFKSWKMVAISLIPNILPMLVMSGIMGFFDINLKTSTAILFTIAFGIAVDDTIHFVSKLRMELKEGKSLIYAVKTTFLTTAKPIIITSVVLCAGFGILGFSSFEGTKMIGILISVILFFALIGDLILLPVLIMLFYRRKGLKVRENQDLAKDITTKLNED